MVAFFTNIQLILIVFLRDLEYLFDIFQIIIICILTILFSDVQSHDN
jgi:hypothetical protein